MLKKMSIRTKLLFLLMLPIVTATGFAFVGFYFSSFEPYLQARKTERTVQKIEVIFELIHELQKERGFTIGFLTSAGQKFMDEMKQQRSEVDKKLQNLPEDLKQRLVVLPDVRKSAENLEMTPLEALNTYSNIIESLFIYMKESASGIKHSELFKLLEAQLFLAYARENAGKEKALLNSVFTKNVIEPSDRDLWYRAIGNQEFYIRAFYDFAPLEMVQLYGQRVKDDGVEKFRQILKEKTDFFGVNPEDWFRVSTERMNNMEFVIHKMRDLINEKSKEIANVALRNGLLFTLLGLPPLVAFLLISLLIMRSILKTTYELSSVIQYIGKEGRFDREVRIETEEELGKMAESFNGLVVSMRNIIAEMQEVMLSASKGDFSKRIVSELRGDLLILKEKINKVMEVMGTLTASTLSVANTSMDVGKAMETVEEGARSQAESTERMASAVEEISTAVEDTAISTELAFQSAEQAYEFVQASAELMERFKLTMQKVKEDGEKIGQVASAIQTVAEQVNLLALNAAIEAARAGEQGRGFAVVADEVRRLADQVGRMAQSVSETTQEVVNSILEGYKRTQEVYESFGRVEESTSKIKEMLQRVSASMEETSAGIREIASSLERLMEVGNANAVAAEKVLSSVMELVKVAEKARESVGSLRE